MNEDERNSTRSADDVYRFWLPDMLEKMQHDEIASMATWWMQGGATAE